MKTIRDNEPNIKVPAAGTNLENGDLSEILYSVIRHLNYLYDNCPDIGIKEAILDKKARLLLQLVLLDEKVDKINYPNLKARQKAEG